MKTMIHLAENKKPVARINPELDQYDGVTLFPDKFAKAKEKLKKSGPPKLPTSDQNHK